MSDENKKMWQDFAQSMLQRSEESLKEFCEESGLAYIPRGSEGRDDLMEKFESYNKQKELQEKAEEEQLKAEMRIREQKQLVNRFEQLIPPRYKNADTSDFKQTGILEKLLNGCSALILGSNGYGKTHLAWALGRKWVNNGETVEIVKAQRLLSMLKSQQDVYGFIVRVYKDNVKHLIIDEIDKIFESKADFVYLNYLIDIRYEWMMQTILIGNGSKTNFINALGQSIFSRITGEGGIFVEANASDKRQEVSK